MRAGDAVRQGQVLARLDDRDLKVERARLFAQREQLGQQYRDAMSRQERSQVRISESGGVLTGQLTNESGGIA